MPAQASVTPTNRPRSLPGGHLVAKRGRAEQPRRSRLACSPRPRALPGTRSCTSTVSDTAPAMMEATTTRQRRPVTSRQRRQRLQSNSLPYIVQGCMESTLSQSGMRCPGGLDACGAGQVQLLTSFSGRQLHLHRGPEKLTTRDARVVEGAELLAEADRAHDRHRRGAAQPCRLGAAAGRSRAVARRSLNRPAGSAGPAAGRWSRAAARSPDPPRRPGRCGSPGTSPGTGRRRSREKPNDVEGRDHGLERRLDDRDRPPEQTGQHAGHILGADIGRDRRAR